MADMEAKHAAEGLTLKPDTLPQLLKCITAINASAVKQTHNSEIKQYWQHSWRNSKRG